MPAGAVRGGGRGAVRFIVSFRSLFLFSHLPFVPCSAPRNIIARQSGRLILWLLHLVYAYLVAAAGSRLV